MGYWPHSNPEPAVVDQAPASKASPCPGVCNRDWRKAERDHRKAEDLEKALAELQERAPRVVRCKACLNAEPGHGITPEAGQPIWCSGCTKRIARSLLSLPDLYVQLELDKMHGTRKADRDPNSGHQPAASASPSPSPPVDEQDSLARFLAEWEDAVRDVLGFSHRPARLPTITVATIRSAPRSIAVLAASTESETMMGAIRFLTVHLDTVLAHPGLSRDFGRAVVAEATELRRRTSMHEQRTRKKARCPRCSHRSLVHEGGETYVACERIECGRLMSLDEYDEIEAATERRGSRSVGTAR